MKMSTAILVLLTLTLIAVFASAQHEPKLDLDLIPEHLRTKALEHGHIFGTKYGHRNVQFGKKNNKSVLTCIVCRRMLDTAFGWLEAGDSRDEIVIKLTDLCVEFDVSTERVCRGVIDINIDVLLWIVDAKNATSTPLTPSQMCGFFMYPDCNLDWDPFTWTLDLDFAGPKPPVVTPQPPPEGSPTIKVLQFTDVHVDPNYYPGYNAECGEPMCCRFDQGIPENASAAAGYWGDYRDCDSPIYAFVDQLQHAASTHQDVTYVIFTGDIIDHAWWITSESYNTALITLIRDYFAMFFPQVPLLPIVGNHEAHPSNVFSDPLLTEIPDNLSTNWLYSLWSEIWSIWLPPETASDILLAGRYTYEVQPGLVVIGINTMFCYSANWWLLYDNVDPAGELQWLAARLFEIEQQGKKAHILAHHPSGQADCTHFWSSQYARIIDRFENTVIAQFHGHTHFDQFNIQYASEDTSRASSVSFTAGSGTPDSDLNPNYRVYTLEGDFPGSNFRVLDHETWSYNLTEANLAGSEVRPNWQKLYSFNDAYGTSSLLPAELDNLVRRMANDTELQELYFRYYVKAGDTSLANGCDPQCLRNLMCEIVTTVIQDTSKCDEILP